MDLLSETPAIIEFGRFRVLPHRRELLADDRPVKLGGRGFDMLMALIEARGTVLGKGPLMPRVWPNRIVAEESLHAQVSALRTALGVERELIRTVPGRGYQLSGEIRVLADEQFIDANLHCVRCCSSKNLPALAAASRPRKANSRERLTL
jgi:DNA-binding winged helix-turn-helix (wHTH) protein